ncbi:MAG: lytic transglycosylase domain-containing protein [Firmicutes bacterium]|jgi:soluble lytic murein transglycosylase|nr:lytic transglycosylase domain-containing protein [Bacillota bacterium]
MIIDARRLRRPIVILIALGLLSAVAVRTHWVQRAMNPLRFVEPITLNSRRFGVDPFLVSAIIRVESRFRIEARSPKGAVGLMQIMPETGRWAAEALGIGDYTDAVLLDPATNIMIGTWYLSWLRGEFDGSLPLMLAAYNGGPKHVARWVREGIWSGEFEDSRQIPFAETARYVVRVIDAYTRYRQVYRARWPGGEIDLSRW